MGSASSQAIAAATAALESATVADLAVARELFAAARALDASPQLNGALADWAASDAARAKVVADVFGSSLGATATSLLTVVVEQHWSNAADLVDGVEELAVRAASLASPGVDLEGEIFEVSRVVAGTPELELALGSRIGEAAAKGRLVDALLAGRASEATTLIVSSLVQQPRDRRVRSLLDRAMRVVSDQRGRAVATVFVAAPLSSAQEQRLADALSRKYGTQISLNTVVDATVVGGVRVQIADDLIDASVSTRLADLRQRLAG
jgi:F-type H+-transporting ATPase subunit delta